MTPNADNIDQIADAAIEWFNTAERRRAYTKNHGITIKKPDECFALFFGELRAVSGLLSKNEAIVVAAYANMLVGDVAESAEDLDRQFFPNGKDDVNSPSHKVLSFIGYWSEKATKLYVKKRKAARAHETRVIKILARNGEQYDVKATVLGEFGVTKAARGATTHYTFGGGSNYHVTHLSTGYAVASTRLKSEAVKIAKKLSALGLNVEGETGDQSVFSADDISAIRRVLDAT